MIGQRLWDTLYPYSRVYLFMKIVEAIICQFWAKPEIRPDGRSHAPSPFPCKHVQGFPKKMPVS